MDAIISELLEIAKGILKAVESLHETTKSIGHDAKAAKNAAERKHSQPVRAEVEFSPGVIQTYESHAKDSHSLQKRTFWAGLITLVILAAYTTFAALQWSEIRKSANAAKSAADTAANSLKATQEFFRNDQRAWVGATTIEPPSLKDSLGRAVYFKEGSPSTFGIDIINSGKSPALKTNTHGNWRILQQDIKFSPVYPSDPQGWIRSMTVLQPQMHLVLSPGPTPAVNAVDITELKTRKKIFYLFGNITYEDIFGNSRHTRFCVLSCSDSGQIYELWNLQRRKLVQIEVVDRCLSRPIVTQIRLIRQVCSYPNEPWVGTSTVWA